MDWKYFALVVILLVIYNLETVTFRFRKKSNPPRLPQIIVEGLKKQLKH